DDRADVRVAAIATRCLDIGEGVRPRRDRNDAQACALAIRLWRRPRRAFRIRVARRKSRPGDGPGAGTRLSAVGGRLVFGLGHRMLVVSKVSSALIQGSRAGAPDQKIQSALPADGQTKPWMQRASLATS